MLYFFAIGELTKTVAVNVYLHVAWAMGVGGFALQQCNAYSKC